MAHIEDTSADVKPRGTAICILHRISPLLKGCPGRFTICSLPRIIRRNSGGREIESAWRGKHIESHDGQGALAPSNL